MWSGQPSEIRASLGIWFTEDHGFWIKVDKLEYLTLVGKCQVCPASSAQPLDVQGKAAPIITVFNVDPSPTQIWWIQ